MVAQNNIVQNIVVYWLLSLLNIFQIAASCAGFRRSGQEDFELSVRDNHCADISAIHDKALFLCHISLKIESLQIDGPTENVMSSEPLEDKLRAFNFNVLTIDGHDYDQIEKAIAAFHAESEKPTCILLDTIKGKGVSFMENAVDWHGKGPNDEEYEIAMKELTAAYAALEEEEK